MKTRSMQVGALVAVAVAVLISGCNTRPEKDKDYAILKGGQQVSAEMVGWVAVPHALPAIKQDNGVSYAVLATHNVVTENLSGWVAINPAFFTKLSKINIDAPKAVAAERWVLKPEGKSIPNDKDGWIALPYSEPQIERSDYKKDREMATLTLGNIIPKEMHGWVAIDRDTLAKLVSNYMNTGSGSNVSKNQ